MCLGLISGSTAPETYANDLTENLEASVRQTEAFIESAADPKRKAKLQAMASQGAYAGKKAELTRRKSIQDSFARLAAERDAAIKSQQEELQRLVKSQEEAQLKQQETREALTAKYMQQEQQLAAQRQATQAAAASYRVLANDTQTGPPTATETRGGARGAAGAKTTSATSSLRIGESNRGSGVGVNLGG